jgi:hypothetical protein
MAHAQIAPLLAVRRSNPARSLHLLPVYAGSAGSAARFSPFFVQLRDPMPGFMRRLETEFRPLCLDAVVGDVDAGHFAERAQHRLFELVEVRLRRLEAVVNN